MGKPKAGRFFRSANTPADTAAQAADDTARQREVAALLPARRTVVQDVAVERLRPNPYQARQTFDGLAELAATMQAQGFVSRLRVRPDPQQPGYFQLVFGERRLRAAILAGLETVPCEVADHTDDDMIEIGLAENIQRHDLAPLEEAHAFQTFIAARGYSIRRLAERIGKDKSYVEDRLALLRAPEDVQQLVRARPDSLRAAREIARLPADVRAPIIAGVQAGTLSTADVRAQAQAHATAGSAAASAERRLIARETAQVRAVLARWMHLSGTDAELRELVRAQTVTLLYDLDALSTQLDGG